MIRLCKRVRREQDKPAWHPGPCVCNHVPHGPLAIIKIKIFDVANFSIQSAKFVSMQPINAI
jgi:hypothetical protein